MCCFALLAFAGMSERQTSQTARTASPMFLPIGDELGLAKSISNRSAIRRMQNCNYWVLLPDARPQPLERAGPARLRLRDARTAAPHWLHL